MKIILVRHGISLANENKLVTGTIDDPLSSTGVTQAKNLAGWLKYDRTQDTQFYTSQWLRARQTAELLHQDEWHIDGRIGETNAGQVANLNLQKFLAFQPDFYSSPANEYPGGESHIQLNDRVLEWVYERAQDDKNRTIIAVTHSGPISCILQHFLKVPFEQFPAFLPLNASVTALEISECEEELTGKLLCYSLVSQDRATNELLKGAEQC